METLARRLTQQTEWEGRTVDQLNETYQKLPGSYRFAEIDRRVTAYRREHPDRELIRLGIGDVTPPLARAVVSATKQAAAEMGLEETFRGDPPYRGMTSCGRPSPSTTTPPGAWT